MSVLPRAAGIAAATTWRASAAGPIKHYMISNLPACAGLAEFASVLQTIDVEVDPATVAVTFERFQLRAFVVPLPAEAVARGPHPLFWRNFHVKVYETPASHYRHLMGSSACLRGPGVVIVGPLPLGDERPALADVLAGFRLAESRAEEKGGEARIAFTPLPNNTAKGGEAMSSVVVRLRSHEEALVLLRERDGTGVRHPDGSTRVTRIALSPLSAPLPPLQRGA